MEAFWDNYGSTIEFSMAFSLFALSTYAALRSGVLSLAAVPFAAVTGFVSLVLIEDHGVAVEIMMVIGVVLGALSALVVGLPLLRLESHWIALATIAFVLMARVVVLNIENVTGGSQGKPVTRTIETWQVLLVLLLAAWVMARHRRSRLGLASQAVRTHPVVAASLGVHVIGIRRTMLMLSGAIAGLAGVVFANLVQFLSPDTFYVNVAFVMLAAVVLGGAFHWFGAIVGAFVFTLLPELLRNFLTEGERIINGILLILVMIFLPRGLVDPSRRLGRQDEAEARAREQAEGEDSEFWELSLTGATVETTQAFSTGTIALEIHNLTKTYGGLVAVEDLAFQVPEASTFGVVGPNGAGKSTLLSLVDGSVLPDSGRIVMYGEDISGLSPHEVATRGVARTYQTVQLFEDLTVLENIAVGFHQHRSTRFWDPVFMTARDRRERQTLEEQARELMERVGVIGRPDQYARTLSYANQRRVEIARALAAQPKLLLMDEPTAGMHKLGTQAVGELILELREHGLTVVVIEHNLELVINYCELAVVMDFGRLLCEGLPTDCLSQPHVIEAYFGRKADAQRIESLLELRKHPGR